VRPKFFPALVCDVDEPQDARDGTRHVECTLEKFATTLARFGVAQLLHDGREAVIFPACEVGCCPVGHRS
jgi:hypothetical protein